MKSGTVITIAKDGKMVYTLRHNTYGRYEVYTDVDHSEYESYFMRHIIDCLDRNDLNYAIDVLVDRYDTVTIHRH